VRTRLESAVYTADSVGVAVTRPVARRMGGAALAALDAVLDSRLAGDVVDRVLASRLAGRALSGALQGPLVEEVARDVVRYRVADRLLSDDLVEQTTARVLESDELWLLVEEIARSPAVTAAIAGQSVGFADQVAGGVRDRSRNADAWVERRARRLLRRRPAAPPAPEAP
jgi:hypothetical protein